MPPEGLTLTRPQTEEGRRLIPPPPRTVAAAPLHPSTRPRRHGPVRTLPHSSLLPAAQDEQRKRRALAEKTEKEERKAEKKKCPFCKRFACLC